MEVLIFFLLISKATSVMNNDNVALESNSGYRTTYKVYPDPQDVDEANHSQEYVRFGQSRKTDLTTSPNINYYTNEVNNGQSSWHIKHDQRSFRQPKLLQQGASTSKPEIDIHTHVLQSNPIAQNSVVQHYLTNSKSESEEQKNKEYIQLDHTSGFSSNIEQSDVQSTPESLTHKDAKGAVPTSTVFFKLYHGKNVGDDKKTFYQANVIHQEGPKKAFVHKYVPSRHEQIQIQSQPSYSVAGPQGKSSVHQKSNFYTQYQTYSPATYQTDGQSLSHNEKQNYLTSAGEQSSGISFEGQLGVSWPKYKTNLSPLEKPKTDFHPTTTLKYNQVGNQVLKGINGLPNTLHVIDGKSAAYSQQTNSAQTSQTDQIQQVSGLAGQSQEYQLSHSDHSQVNLFSDQKIMGQVNTNFPNGLHEHHAYYTIKEEQPTQKTVHQQYKFGIKDSPVSATILSQTVPVKTEGYVDENYSDLSHIHDFWANDKIKPEVLQNSIWEENFVTKPVETYHFEINPYIDVDENSQSNFDHQKALEGSSSFDFNHAIGNVKEINHNFNSYIAQQEIPNTSDIPQAVFKTENQALLYAVPSYQMVFKDFHGDSSPANSEKLKIESSTAAGITEVKHKFIEQPITVVSNDNLKHHVSEFHLPKEQAIVHNVKTELPVRTVLALPHFSKQKPIFKDLNLSKYKEAHLNKLVREVSNQPKKTLAYVVTTRPSQKIVPMENVSWTVYKPKIRTSKAHKTMIAPESMQYIKEFGQRVVPVLRTQNRIYREVKAPATIVRVVNRSNDNFKENKSTQLKVVKGNNVNNLSRYLPKNEYSVSASYKIDRSFNKENNES